MKLFKIKKVLLLFVPIHNPKCKIELLDESKNLSHNV